MTNALPRCLLLACACDRHSIMVACHTRRARVRSALMEQGARCGQCAVCVVLLLASDGASASAVVCSSFGSIPPMVRDRMSGVARAYTPRAQRKRRGEAMVETISAHTTEEYTCEGGAYVAYSEYISHVHITWVCAAP